MTKAERQMIPPPPNPMAPILNTMLGMIHTQPTKELHAFRAFLTDELVPAIDAEVKSR